jgi:hypothetical protein
VSYFTARVTKPVDKQVRQGVYLDAQAARGGLDIIEGTHEHRPMRCGDCGHRWQRPQEERSDVNLALALTIGAFDDTYDTALILSADADLVPAVKLIRDRFHKSVVIVSPPGRTSAELSALGHAHLHVNRPTFNRSQLPDPVIDATGRELHRPAEWS